MLHSSTSARLRLLCCCTGGNGMCCEPLPGSLSHPDVCRSLQPLLSPPARLVLCFCSAGKQNLFCCLFFYFNSCSIGGESSLMCKKNVSAVCSLSLNSPRKVHPSLLLPLRLYSENMRLWALTLCDITEGTGPSRRSVATPPVRPPETLCV